MSATANSTAVNETIAALVAERDALKSKLATLSALNSQYGAEAANTEKLVTQLKRRIEFRDTDLMLRSFEAQALEWAINGTDPSGNKLYAYQVKAELFPPDLFEAY